jgi:putative peptide zinc metalloprotease protein
LVTTDTRDLDLRDHAEVEVPSRATGVELLGELDGSGFEDPPFLARRGDGQTIQLTELLYRVLECIDGERDLAALAATVSDRIGKQASSDDVDFLVREKLRPLGLVRGDDGGEPDVEKPNPLLALRFRVVLSDERITRRLTAPFAALFWPPIVVAVVAAFTVMTGWLLFAEGVGASTRAVLYQPSLLVLVFVLTALSAGFHEFGHAAACRYGGATPGVMGAGLYLVWPAFYTDVTDSYRLSKGGRLRTDLGGLYFNMLFALATFGVWALTRWTPLLLLVPLQLLQMVHQLLPFVRLDGYLILSDLTGVPDLFARIKPTLRSALPGRATDERAAALKPWVRVVVTVWVLLVIPVLLLGVVMMALTLPRLAATAWDSAGRELDAIGGAGGDAVTIAAAALSLLALLLPVVSTLYLLGRLAVRLAGNRWGRVALVAAAVAAVWLWWPNGEYRPIQRDEPLRLQDAARTVSFPEGAEDPVEPAGTEASTTTTVTPTTATTVAPTTETTADPSVSTAVTTSSSSTTTTSTTEAPSTTTTTTSSTTTETTSP